MGAQLENFIADCTADLQHYVRRALQRDWPARRRHDLRFETRDNDALQAVLEDARRRVLLSGFRWLSGLGRVEKHRFRPVFAWFSMVFAWFSK